MVSASMGDNGFSNRHAITLTGYRILEAVKGLAHEPAIAVGGEKITKRHIANFLSENGFSVDDTYLKGELIALGTAFFLSHDTTHKSYALTDRGRYQIKANHQGHATLPSPEKQPKAAP